MVESLIALGLSLFVQSTSDVFILATHELPKLNSVVGGDHLCRLFSDHDRRGIGVPTDDTRHDTGIHHAQLSNTCYAKSRIDDATDSAGRRKVVNGY